MELLTSLAVAARSVGRREEGHLGHEVVSLALIILAIVGAISLFGHLG